MRAVATISLAVLLIAGHAIGGEVIDRIVARVNRRVVLQSELDDAMRYQAMVAQRGLDSLTAADRKQALDQLIDQVLIDQQIDRSAYVRVPKADLDRQIIQVRRQLGVADRAGWEVLLARYDLTQQDVEERLAWQLDILRYVDSRFRPNIHIDKRSIETYYQDQLLPQVRKASGREVPLAEVSGKIEEILIQQRIDELMSAWLRNLRTQEEVQLQ